VVPFTSRFKNNTHIYQILGEPKKNLKTALIATITVIGLLATTQVASAASRPTAAKKQTVKFSVTGDCKDEAEMIEDESEDNCKIVATISSSSPSRKAVLEQLNEDDEWDEVAQAKSKSGKISFKIEATDEDDAWLEGDFTFRVLVAKSGSNKAYTSKEYTFTFTPADSDNSDNSDDSGSGEASTKQKGKSTGNAKLDTVLADLDSKDTKYDDSCEKSFGEDCKLMFTPTGPDWTKLTAAKWQPMCEKLLKQSAENCKKMYGAGGEILGAPSTGGTAPTGGNNNSGYKITEAEIQKACTAAGITDCTAIIKAMTSGTPPTPEEMNKLLGSKMNAFWKAMPPPPQP